MKTVYKKADGSYGFTIKFDEYFTVQQDFKPGEQGFVLMSEEEAHAEADAMIAANAPADGSAQ